MFNHETKAGRLAASSAATSATARPRIRHMDGLRGIAAMSVAVVFHYSAFSNVFQPGALPLSSAPGFDPPFVNAIYPRGDVAVDVFFIISGFVFSKIYGLAIAGKHISAHKFAAYRFARLYPVHFLTLLVTAFGIFDRGILCEN